MFLHLHDQGLVYLDNVYASPIQPEGRSDLSDRLVLAARENRLDMVDFLARAHAGNEIEIRGKSGRR
jgi:hypothetical protein